jgi:hypothetical protein
VVDKFFFHSMRGKKVFLSYFLRSSMKFMDLVLRSKFLMDLDFMELGVSLRIQSEIVFSRSRSCLIL